MRRRIHFAVIVLALIPGIGPEGKAVGDVAGQLAEAERLAGSTNYEQAELIYRQILAQFPDSNDALEAQKQLTFLYITADQEAQADAAFAELTAAFAGHKDIAKAVWDVGFKYKNAGNAVKAEQIHGYNVASFTAHKHAMWSQVEILYSSIEQGDGAGADAAVDALLSLFALQETLPREIHRVGVKFNQNGRKAKALELWYYNVANFPNTEDAMWSQAEIVRSHIRKGDDSPAADAAVARLLSGFARWETLAREIYQIGRAYAEARRPDKALEIWNYNVENHPEDRYAMWSQVETVYSHIRDGNDTAADTAVGRLLSVFAKQPTLSLEIRQIAERFGSARQTAKALDLHAYNVEIFPKSVEAMGSQLDIVDYYLDDVNDPDAAAAAAQMFVSVFSEQEGVVDKAYEIAGRLAKAGRPDDAIGLYQYNADNFPDEPNGLLSQVQIAYLNIDKKDPAGIDAAVNELVTDFAGNADLPEAVWSVARRLNGRGYPDKALAVHRINIERHRDDKFGMWSQVETIYVYLRDPNADEAIVDAEVNKLLADFAGQSTISREVRQVAKEFAKQGTFDRAVQLHEYNIETYPADSNAVWSQADIFELYVPDGNDLTTVDWAAADAAVAKLLSRFGGKQELAKAMRKVGSIYNARGRPDKAMELWSANVESAPDSIDAMLSQMDIIYAYIDNNDVNDAAVDGEVDKLLTKFAKQPTLPRSVHDIGNRYRDKKNYERAIHSYNLVDQKWPSTDFALWSRSAAGKTHILQGDDESVHTTIDGLITDFKDHEKMPQVVFQLGEEYYNMAFVDPNKFTTVKSEDHLNKAKDVWQKIIAQRQLSESIEYKHAQYFTAVCYRRLGQYENALAHYQKVVDDWPDYQYAWSAQYLTGSCYEKLIKSGVLTASEAGSKIEQSYKAVVERYPNSPLTANACMKLSDLNLKRGQPLEVATYLELFLVNAHPSDPRIESVRARFEELLEELEGEAQ